MTIKQTKFIARTNSWYMVRALKTEISHSAMLSVLGDPWADWSGGVDAQWSNETNKKDGPRHPDRRLCPTRSVHRGVI